MAKISLPPPSHKFEPQYHVIRAGTSVKRIYNPTTEYKVRATTFRYFGPRSRFDHQERINGKAQLDLNRGIIYGAFSLTCCLVEIFAEDGIIEIGEHELATITVLEDLKLLDIRVRQVWNAGTTVATVNEGTRSLTQAWGCYFYNNPEIYGQVAGLIYNSTNNGEEAIALYERAESIITSSKISIQKIRDINFRGDILVAAKSLGIPVRFV